MLLRVSFGLFFFLLQCLVPSKSGFLHDVRVLQINNKMCQPPERVKERTAISLARLRELFVRSFLDISIRSLAREH